MPNTAKPTTGYAPVNGLDMYHEIYGEASVVEYVARGKADMRTRQVELTDLDIKDSLASGIGPLSISFARFPAGCGRGKSSAGR